MENVWPTVFLQQLGEWEWKDDARTKCFVNQAKNRRENLQYLNALLGINDVAFAVMKFEAEGVRTELSFY